MLHELGHAAITQLSIPVLGKPEDAADSFAAVGLIRIGSTFTQRVLADAAKGWFLNDRRDVATDDTVAGSRFEPHMTGQNFGSNDVERARIA